MNLTEDWCIACGVRNVTTEMKDIEFGLRIAPLGEQNSTVTLTATVPVLHCDVCNFDYCNYVADDIKEQVVNDFYKAVERQIQLRKAI